MGGNEYEEMEFRRHVQNMERQMQMGQLGMQGNPFSQQQSLIREMEDGSQRMKEKKAARRRALLLTC